MPKPRRNGRESRHALKEMQKRSVVYAMKTAKTPRDYTSAKRIGV